MGQIVKDAFLVPGSKSEVVDRMRSMLAADTDTDAVSGPFDPGDARVLVESAIDRGRRTLMPLESDTWPLCRPLVQWLLRLMPEGGSVPESPEWGRDELDAIAEEFLASRHGSSFDDDDHRGLLLSALHEEARRNPTRRSAWLATLAQLGDDPRSTYATTEQLASGLQVAALFTDAPLLDAAQVLGAADDDAPHPKLARVRALLAKAESTPYDEEAEALSAKAQELISRYALGQLLGTGGEESTGSPIVTRRIWLDAPYLRAKSSLVHHVAAANHARAVFCERQGFSLVVGARHDVDAVDLLVSSLLVQATRALLRYGRRSDVGGTSRTRSFRQSFLYAYAARIGQRLREAAQTVIADTVPADDAERLLPVLRDHDERVTQAFEAMMPDMISREVTISNREGYAAGLVAADLALLDVTAQIHEQTG